MTATSPGPSPLGNTICALLGPTNTGKTHRAIERMLEHRSGMMGLPLRLLAREVYDRVSERCGESQVALVTGEEKRIPPRPRYWICTVEAMPMSTEVEFLAIDEIQLAAHPERGHVFTERLLGARGQLETWFMGAETMRELLAELVPTAKVTKSPRLSTLRSTGSSSLGSLPRRSAVVAFSLPRVFEIAERIRHRRGGAAVVIGALSPRARNAQVALYQAKEVDFLVATDAIGMGLNLDIDHVAFADLRKFDGRLARDLDPAELAQIAGRAGRHTRDGTFGTLAPLPDLSHDRSRAVEAHAFASLRSVHWRNADLDFASTEDLLASLKLASTSRRLKRVDGALDQAILSTLCARPDIRRLARDEASVRLLWSACSIPDYRQLLFEEHVALVTRVFDALARWGHVPFADITLELDRIDRGDGDIETLMDRIASIRTWNFVAHQAGWAQRATELRERARRIEDDLSDALHAALVNRFVESGGRAAPVDAKPRGSRPGSRSKPASGADESATSAVSPFAKLAHLRSALPDASRHPSTSVDWQSEGPRAAEHLERVIDASHAQLTVDEGAWLYFDETRMGRLVRGRSLSMPEVVVTVDADAGYKLRLRRRLLAWSRDLVREIVGGVGELEGLGPHGRGLAHLLTQSLGTVLAADAQEQVAGLDAHERAAFERASVVLGQHVVYLASALKPAAIGKRIALANAFIGSTSSPTAVASARTRWPVAGERTIPSAKHLPDSIYLAIGYPVWERRAVRADILERQETERARRRDEEAALREGVARVALETIERE